MVAAAPSRQFQIGPEISEDRELSAAVDRATDLLRRELRRAADRVTGEWRAVRENGHRFVELFLNDEDLVSSTTRFEVGQLTNDEQLERQLARFWGEMLQEKNHRQLDRLREIVSQLEDQ